MALSILSYNLPQGFKMSANASNNNTGSNLCTSPPTGDENSSNSSAGRTTINIGKSFSRITMQNVLSESSSNALNISNNSNVNTIVRKIKDIGMYGSVNNAGALSTTMAAARKRTNSETPTLKADASANENKTTKAKPPNKRAKFTNKDEALCAKEPNTPTNKAPASTAAKLSKTSTPGAKKPAGTPGRKGLPLPQAVARRNARERNRVKQVNNGFTALRERIPEEIAEVFEAQGNGRGTVKKLSKVETLRMAVEYIRSLERLLGFDFPIGSDRGLKLLQGASSSDDSFTFVKDEFDALSPPLDDSNYDDTLSQYDVDEYLNNTNDFGNQSISQTSLTDARAYEMDLLPSLTTINGLQYVRIPGTNTYQLLTPDVLFMAANAPHSPPTSSLDEESFQALIDTNCMSPVAAAAITTSSPHISPASEGSAINAAPATLQQQQQQQQRELMSANSGEIVGECVNATRSPSVQQSSPTVHSSLHQRQPQQLPACQPQTPTQGSSNLSPADNNTFLLQTCATPSAATTSADEIDGYTKEDRNEENVCRSERFVPLATTPTTLTLPMQPPSHAIKQEFNDTLTGFARANDATTTPSPQKSLTAGALIFQQQLQERLLLSHASLATMSPPLERCSSSGTPTTTNMLTTTPTMLYVSNSATTPTSTTPGLSSSFYDVEQDNSYFESVAHINALKKEYGNALLQAAAQAAEHGNTLSALPDESIIEVMDWWEAHTPKSDGGAALL